MGDDSTQAEAVLLDYLKSKEHDRWFNGAIAVLLLVAAALLTGALSLAGARSEVNDAEFDYHIYWVIFSSVFVLLFGLFFSVVRFSFAALEKKTQRAWLDKIFNEKVVLYIQLAGQVGLLFFGLVYLMKSLTIFMGGIPPEP